jgi:hypothetical protein
MTAVVQALARYHAARIETGTKGDSLIGIAVFCGAGLVASLICVVCGLDLSAGSF